MCPYGSSGNKLPGILWESIHSFRLVLFEKIIFMAMNMVLDTLAGGVFGRLKCFKWKEMDLFIDCICWIYREVYIMFRLDIEYNVAGWTTFG